MKWAPARWCWVAVLFTLSARAGLAQTNGTLTCSAALSSAELRADGDGRLLGEILITCTGGPEVPAGAEAPAVNLTLTLRPPVPVISRLIGADGASEATLTVEAAGVFHASVGEFGSNTVTFHHVPVAPGSRGGPVVLRISNVRVGSEDGVLPESVDVSIFPSPSPNLMAAGDSIDAGLSAAEAAAGGSRYTARAAAGSPCDLNQDGTVDGGDVQAVLQQALGNAPRGGVMAPDASVNVVAIQTVMNGALQLGCVPPVVTRKRIHLMIVVDRSGSVTNEGAISTIKNALNTFVTNANTSSLLDGFDTVGLVTFGHTWRLDYAPVTHFQSASPNIGNAVASIPFDGNSGTNTAEGLYQAWAQLYAVSDPNAFNAMVLLTDGRPSSFTAYFTPSSSSTCVNKTQRAGVFGTYVSLGSFPYWPPPTTPSESFGIFTPQYQGVPEASHFAAPATGCAYAVLGANNVGNDFNNILPASAGPVDNVGPGFVPSFTTPGAGFSTQTGYYPGCSSMSNPRCGRYAAINAADNMASLIRRDTTLTPRLIVIGLSYTATNTEPIDADWLARVANDPAYVTVGSDPTVVPAGMSVFEVGQTAGIYCDSTTATLANCFAAIAGAIR